MTDGHGGGTGSASAGSPNPMTVHTLLFPGGHKKGHAVPVMVYTAAPAWPSGTKKGHTGLRRPVVAVPDTGVTSHPWLAGTPGDPVVSDAADLGWTARTSRITDGPYRGHATFLAGVIRQTAPQARILSVPVMGDDGIVPHDEALSALAWLDSLVSSGQADRFVDVICLAHGYEPGAEDSDHLAQMRELLWKLAGQGVLIVASAGNDGDHTQVFPAAFAADPKPPNIPVTSVGATEPDLEADARYSSYGAWVTHRSVGSEVISTTAPDISTAGFARSSGTSFAAAAIAGLLARALSSDPGVDDLSPEATIGRAKAALATIEPFRTRSRS